MHAHNFLAKKLKFISPRARSRASHSSRASSRATNSINTRWCCSHREPIHNCSCCQPKVLDAIGKLGFLYDIGEASSIIRPCMTELEVELPVGERALAIADNPAKSWKLNYTAISFIFNGQLYAEYCCVCGMLGLPTCSNRQQDRIIKWTEKLLLSLRSGLVRRFVRWWSRGMITFIGQPLTMVSIWRVAITHTTPLRLSMTWSPVI